VEKLKQLLTCVVDTIVVEGPGPHPALLLRARGSYSVPFAEADGNRTRLGALAPTPVLKTGGPTRRPDASGTRIPRVCERRRSLA
jgi:hypothetical protein